MTHRFAIDSLAVRSGRISGWGWLLDDDSAALDITLRWRGDDGLQRSLHCPQLGTRPDLSAAFPAITHAAGGGFMLHGRLPLDADVDACLHARLADGRLIEIPLPAFPGAIQSVIAPTKGRWIRFTALLRERNFAGAWAMIANGCSRFVRGWPQLGMARLSAAYLMWPANDRIVVFDHVMGGGANQFRQELIAKWRAEGHQVLLVTPNLVSLDYIVDGLDRAGEPVRLTFENLDSCLSSLGTVAEVVVNDLVSFDDPVQVLRWAVAQKAQGTRLTFYVHDFHAACPAWTLTADSGRDCGVPDLSICATCLPANRSPFLGLLPSQDLREWRSEWAAFLDACNTIVAFSPSSLRLLRRAHPELRPERVRVEPHSLAYLGVQPPPFKPALDGPTTIAVVGNISRFKGAEIVREMAAIIETEGVDARIVVLGSLDGVPASPVVRMAGAYTPLELPAILTREAVTVAFLPSVVQETFSYVTSEIMHFGVPIVVFDLGAPAERVAGYPLGRVAPAVDARVALGELIALHRQLAANASAHAAISPAGSP